MRRLRVATSIAPLAWFAFASFAFPHGAPVWIVSGERAGDELGTAVAGLGDVDGDGHPDVAVGEPKFDGAAGVDCGRVRVYSPLTGQLLWTFEGEAPGDLFGSSIAQIGDVDVDGHNDIAIGAPNHTGPAGAFSGKVYLFSGANGSLMRSWDGEAGGSLGTAFGFSLSQSDVTNDGHAELIVGAPRFDGAAGTWCGKVYVFDTTSGAVVHEVEGEQAFSYFGFSVSGIGDLNFDFHQDFLVGAPYFSGIASPYNGKAYSFSGATGQVIRTWEGETATSLFGFDVADAGDADSDGARDVAVSADEENIPGQTNVGKVFIFSGITGNLIRSLLGDGGEDGLLFGCSLSYIGDVDHDNYGDLLVGARGNWGPNGWGYGSAFIFSGKTGDILIEWSGEAAKDGFGVSVSGAGDTDGDGSGDVVIGAFGSDNGSKFESGRAYVYSADISHITLRPFGQSRPGSGGFAPRLTGSSPFPDRGMPLMHIEQALGGANAFLWIGLGHGDLFPFFGGHLYINPAQPWILLPLALGGMTGVPGAGTATLAASNLGAFPGLVLYVQAVVIDPGSSSGVSLSNALEAAVRD